MGQERSASVNTDPSPVEDVGCLLEKSGLLFGSPVQMDWRRQSKGHPQTLNPRDRAAEQPWREWGRLSSRGQGMLPQEGEDPLEARAGINTWGRAGGEGGRADLEKESNGCHVQVNCHS